jgi:hypothetical protein
MRYRVTKNMDGEHFLEGTVCDPHAPHAPWMWKDIAGPFDTEQGATAAYRRERQAERKQRTVVWTEEE